jgi:hypothetical protein
VGGVSAGIEFAPDGRWVRLPVEGDPAAWAREATVRLQGSRTASTDPWIASEVLAGQLAVLAEGSVASRPESAWVLVPTAGAPGPVVEVVVAQGELEDVVAELTLHPDLLVGGPERDELDTGAGPAVRLRQRWRDSKDHVLDTTAFAWPDADAGLVVVALCTTGDLVQAEQVQPDLEALASACSWIPA